ncbi:MAG: hypothetical protein ACMG57_03405 [Candidatus Dojkabacteria bacterium]
MEHVIFFSLVIFTSFIWSLLEIQIEGKNGWAGALPTWRYQVHIKYIWEREITGYHVYLISFILLLLHSTFLYTAWSMQAELKIIAFFLLLGGIEDFLWFVLNPAYGLKKFNRIDVPWHTMWFLGVPTFYFIIIPLGVFIYAISLTL